jgi:hypothetical protein
MKYIITESQDKMRQRLRRIQEIRDSIDFQTEIQDPCNFEDGEEYADFCIGEALCFFYRDENCENDDDYDDDDEDDYDDENERRSKSNSIYLDDDYPERDEVTDLMYKEYYDDLVSLWGEMSEGYDC